MTLTTIYGALIALEKERATNRSQYESDVVTLTDDGLYAVVTCQRQWYTETDRETGKKRWNLPWEILVKSRSGNGFWNPDHYVTSAKLPDMIEAAWFLKSVIEKGNPCPLSVAEVERENRLLENQIKAVEALDH